MATNSYEDLNNNESVQSDTNLQNLIKQIDEIKDTIKDNDKVEWVFEETPEWQAIKKSLKQWLEESLYQNPDTCKLLVEQINRLLKDSSLQLNDDIRNSLISLWSLLNWILNDFIISDNATDKLDTSEDETYTEEDFIIPDDATDNPKAPENEVLDNTPVSLEFLDSLTEDDLKSLVDEKRSIKKELIKEENWKKYIIFKWERFDIGKYWYDTFYGDYGKKSNTILVGSGAILLWSKSSYLEFRIKYNDIKIFNWRGTADIIKFGNWQSMRTYENENWVFRSSNGIDVRTERIIWKYRFYSNNNSVLTFGLDVANTEFIKVTSILSKIKGSKEQCKIVDEHTLQVWDTTYEFLTDVNDIAEWINNYYN